MTATETKIKLERLGLTVGTMFVAVGNIYQCQELDGYDWMYENQFTLKAEKYLEARAEEIIGEDEGGFYTDSGYINKELTA